MSIWIHISYTYSLYNPASYIRKWQLKNNKKRSCPFLKRKDNLKQESCISSSPKDQLQYTSYPWAYVRFLNPQSQICQVNIIDTYTSICSTNCSTYESFYPVLIYINLNSHQKSIFHIYFFLITIVLLVWGTPWCWTWNWAYNLLKSQLSIFNYQRGTECLSRNSIINIHSAAIIAWL